MKTYKYVFDDKINYSAKKIKILNAELEDLAIHGHNESYEDYTK
jgi:hypothetical protein